MALHLLNGMDNEHVTVHEVSGFVADDVLGAFNEIHALSKGTKCKQFMYSLSLNPPQDAEVPVEDFEAALDAIEKRLGLDGQARVVVFHEKEGRRHAHCVWSRIDIETMTAKNMSHDRRELNDISKSLFLEHGWRLPDGFRNKSRGNPLNYTRAEWQQAARIGRKPQDIKRELQECWAASDSRKSFKNALGELGYFLAEGDRRGYVAVDVYGEVYSLTRQLGQRKKALEAKLGKTESLPSVAKTKDKISNQLSGLFTRYMNELKAHHDKQSKPLRAEKQKMTKAHRDVRKGLEDFQQERWQKEELQRNARIRSGFKGLWDKLNGRYWKTRKANERETWKSYMRDQKEREKLISSQLQERQALQAQLELMRGNQDQEKQELIRDLTDLAPYAEKKGHNVERSKSRDKDHHKPHDFNDFDRDDDFEPEL